MNNISADVIIVNYNSTKYSLRCIESVHRNIRLNQINIVVIDNNSNDQPEKITQRYPQVKLIKSSRNLGFGKAINYALRTTSSRYILLLNPDSRIVDTSFTCIFKYLEDHPKVSVAGPMILDQDGGVQGSARRFPTAWTSIFGRKSPLTKLFPNNPITKKEFLCFSCNSNEAIDVDWVSGACMAIRREAINQIGGFDERFFLYWEDTDLCKRIREAGWRVVYYPEVRIFHSVGKSSETKAIGSMLHFHISCFKLFVKHAKMMTKLLMPLAFAGLTVRCLFVIILYLSNTMILNVESRKIANKPYCSSKKNKKIKTIRIISRLNIGGPSIHVTLLSKKMDPKRFETILLVGTKSPYEGDMSYLLKGCSGEVRSIHELQREINLRKDLIALIKIFLLIAREKPDIVHTHMSKAGTIGRIAAGFWKLFGDKHMKILHTFHGHVLEGYFGPVKSAIFRFIETAMAKFSDAVIAISQSQQWELVNKYQIATSKKVYAINLGFDLSRFSKKHNYEGTLRKILAIGNDTLLVGIVGRLVPIKNHQMFLDGAKIFIAKNPNIDVKFLIVGDGELRQYLETYSEKIGISDKVVFLGWQKELRYIYADLDVLALTSINEGTPVSIIEAMASEVPIITTGVGGVKDLLGKYEEDQAKSRGFVLCERGILLKKDDYASLANGIEYILDNKNREQINLARQYVIQNYSDKKLIERMEQLYNAIL